MAPRVHIAALLAVAGSLAGCGEDRDAALPPARLESRNAALDEVRARLADLAGADLEKTTALLRHRDLRVRRAAALRLMGMGPAAAPAVPELVVRLGDKQPRVRTAAARALGAIGAPEAAEPLTACLVDGDRQARLWCWKALRELGDQAIPAVADQLATGTRIRALTFVDEAGRLRHGYDELIDRLASLGAPAVPVLMERLRLEDIQLCGAMLLALGRMGADAKDALPSIVTLIEGAPDMDTKLRTIRTIEAIGDLHPEVVPALKKAAESADKQLAEQAKKTLRALEKAAKAKPKSEAKALTAMPDAARVKPRLPGSRGEAEQDLAAAPEPMPEQSVDLGL